MRVSQIEQSPNNPSGFEECPACAYSLRGAEFPTLCPECGFHIPANSVLYRPSGRNRFDLIPMSVVALVGIGLFKASPIQQSFTPCFHKCLFGISIWLLLWAAAFGFRHLRFAYQYEFLLLTPVGLRFRMKGQPEYSKKWAEITHVTISRYFEQVLVHECETKRVVGVPRFFWPKKMSLSDFAAIFEEARRNAQSPVVVQCH